MQWRKACDTNTCVEVLEMKEQGLMLLRSNRDPITFITLTQDEWDQFVSDIKAGAFDA